ncbi:MAG: threo-3-hydroxy-L-aspartate ammonia-lyase [Myxococcales bacterium]|nr:threo-3-hydroxy-L-aspartate ammonia-lyase [Myxococcales bacterium]
MTLPIGFDDVVAAHERIADLVHQTPVLTSRTADERSGATMLFKAENLQRTGAFKFRGACNALRQFDDAQRQRGVIAYSSGNHAQAIALAARLLQIPATIVMPQDAPASKLAATRGYGAEVVIYDRYSQSREEIGAQLAEERGMTLIPPFDHPHIMAGQGTTALELLREVGGLDVLVVCLGGGGLLSGCATVARHLQPACRVIGVEPEAGNDVQRSLQQGRIVHIDVPRTIADGAQTKAPSERTFAVMRRRVDEVVTVSDEALVRTMRFFAGRMKMVVEPTGCLAAAAVLEGTVAARGKRVGVVISGGNVDLDRFASLLGGSEPTP